jgi:hypothetical protein
MEQDPFPESLHSKLDQCITAQRLVKVKHRDNLRPELLLPLQARRLRRNLFG